MQFPSRDPTEFKEAPENEPNLKFSFTGDPHYGYGAEKWTDNETKNIIRDHWADEVIEDWNHNENFPKIDFGVNVGDYVHFGTAKEYKVASQDSYNKMFLPWMFIFGNHDTSDYQTNTEKSPFKKSGGASLETCSNPYEAVEIGKRETGVMERNYAFQWDNILFLVAGDKGNTMLLTREQRQWLNYMTSLYPEKTTITMSHQALPGQKNDFFYYRYYNNKEWWKSFIENNPQIKLHINGHNHEINHYQYHGLDGIDTGILAANPNAVYFQITKNKIQASVWNSKEKKWKTPNFLKIKTETNISDEGLEWYSVSKRIQDGQDFTHNNKILSENYHLQLIGSDPELINQNREFDYWGGFSGGGPVKWMGYSEGKYKKEAEILDKVRTESVHAILEWIGKDLRFNTEASPGYYKFEGKEQLETATQPAMGYQGFLSEFEWYTKWIDGKVPDSTTPRAIPGKKYQIKCKLKSQEFTENSMDITIKILGENIDQTIAEKKVMKDLDIESEYTIYKENFTVPENEKSWIIKTIWKSKNPKQEIYLGEWSITRADSERKTENFNLKINQENFRAHGTLSPTESKDFTIPPNSMKNELNFRSEISGSKTGLVRMVYEDPILWSDDLSFGILKKENNSYHSLLKPVSKYSKVNTISPFKKIQIENAESNSIKQYYQYWTIENENLPMKTIIEIQKGEN